MKTISVNTKHILNETRWIILFESCHFHRLISIEAAFADVLQIDVLENFTNFTGKRLCWSLFLIKLQAWRAATLWKRGSNTRVFLWNLQKTTFFTEHLRLLLLSVLYLNNWKVLSREQKKQNWAWIMRYAWENFRKCYYHYSVITW